MAEDGKERVDRELIELLNEVRVALPGVQVLFAFLLILPFQQAFAETSSVVRTVYTLALLSSALAAALLIAPSMYHRLNFRRGRQNKEQMLFDDTKLVVAGTLCTAVGVSCAVFMVADVVYGETAAAGLTLLVALAFAGLWVVLPLLRRSGM